eukprot:03465.XXX_148937_149107_1 [CDS] Oithona nana genome sequencing.
MSSVHLSCHKTFHLLPYDLTEQQILHPWKMQLHALQLLHKQLVRRNRVQHDAKPSN